MDNYILEAKLNFTQKKLI